VERRRRGAAARTPMEILEQMPAVVLLERIPVPTLAITGDGSILAANPAVAAMLGYSTEELRSLKFDQIFRRPIEGSAVSVVHAYANQLVELAHADGSTVRATMSRSALLRGDDPVALAMFQDLTEKLWTEGH
jgi:PAS domain S-box-containing protein